jgi:hypothetical protein
MKVWIAAFALTAMAGQAAALSCMHPDAVQTFARAEAEAGSYYLLYGTLDFDASKQPQGVVNKERNPAPIPATFAGFALDKSGFNTAYSTTLNLQPLCAGPWCGTQTPGTQSLFFAKVDGDQITVEASPCGGRIFSDPAQAVLDAMTACINGNYP